MRETSPFPRLLAVIPGFIVGALWIAMATAALISSARGYAHQRTDWGLGWGIVGVLLLAAGVAAIAGTWWHNYRVTRHHH